MRPDVDRIRYLHFRHSRYGSHSGYALLPRAVSALHPRVEMVEHPILRLRISKKLEFLSGINQRLFSKFILPDGAFLGADRPDERTLYHVLNFNTTPKLWRRFPGRKNLVGTLHYFDPGELPDEILSDLSCLVSGITLAESHVPRYEALIGEGRVRFVHYGVDTDFFQPSGRRLESKRLLFVGRIARDFPMLVHVIEQLGQKHPHLKFDLVLSEDILRLPIGRQLGNLPGVSIHHRIPDLQLLRLYQNACLLLLPLVDTGASNTVVEALAAGLPVVTTRTSGISSYGGGSVYPVVPRGDVDGMVGLVERYLSDQSFRDHVSREGRKFAEQHLSWPVTARAHIAAYDQLLA